MNPLLANLMWTTPAMLVGLGLILLPIIAHLLNRRSRKQFIVPSLMFMQQCITHQSSFFKFRRLVLLLLRALAVAMIVAGFARPFWLAGGNAITSNGDSTALVVVIDASLSTTQMVGGSQLYEQSKGAAARALDELKPGRDVASVVFATQNTEPVFQQLSPNLPELKSRLSDSQPSFERADLTGAISLAATQLSAHGGKRMLVVISDMQKTNWESTLELAKQSISLPPETEIRFVTLQPGDTTSPPENLGLSSPVCAPVDPIQDQTCQMSVTLTNYSDRLKQVPLKLLAKTETIAERTIPLSAGESSAVSFSLPYEKRLGKQFTFRISSDVMPADNEAYLALSDTERTHVVVLTDDPPAELGTSSFFLKRALEPFRDKSDRFVATVLSPADLAAAPELLSTDTYKIACVGYVSNWKDSAAKSLIDFVRSGGHLVYLCGEGNVESTMRDLESAAGDAFFPIEVDGLDRFEQFDDYPFIKTGKWRSPWLRDFDIQSQVSLQRIRFQKLWRVVKTLDDAETLLTFSDDRPAVATRMFGKGQVVVFNLSPSVEFSEVGKYGSFVALIQMLLRQLRAVDENAGEQIVGSSITIPITIESKATDAKIDPSDWKVLDPNGDPVRFNHAQTGSGVLLTVGDTQRPGIYCALVGGESGSNDVIAVAAINTDPRESDLRMIVVDDVEKSFGQSVGELAGARFQTNLIDDGFPLWGWMLVCALVAIAIESGLLSWWRS